MDNSLASAPPARLYSLFLPTRPGSFCPGEILRSCKNKTQKKVTICLKIQLDPTGHPKRRPALKKKAKRNEASGWHSDTEQQKMFKNSKGTSILSSVGLSLQISAIFGPIELKFWLSPSMDLAVILDRSNLGNIGPEKSSSDWLEIGCIFSVCLPPGQI